jgi:hypothetical protein
MKSARRDTQTTQPFLKWTKVRGLVSSSRPTEISDRQRGELHVIERYFYDTDYVAVVSRQAQRYCSDHFLRFALRRRTPITITTAATISTIEFRDNDNSSQ